VNDDLSKLNPDAAYFSVKISGPGDVVTPGDDESFGKLAEARAYQSQHPGSEVVVWVDDYTLMPVPDGWPAPKDQRVTVDEIVRVLLEELHPAQNETAQRIIEHGIDCGHQPLDREEVMHILHVAWSKNGGKHPGKPPFIAAADAIVAKFVEVPDQGSDGVTLGGLNLATSQEPSRSYADNLTDEEADRIARTVWPGYEGVHSTIADMRYKTKQIAAELCRRDPVQLDDVAAAMLSKWSGADFTNAASSIKTAWQTTARAALRAAGVEWEEPNG
jgi:hypothetical protein